MAAKKPGSNLAAWLSPIPISQRRHEKHVLCQLKSGLKLLNSQTTFYLSENFTLLFM